LLRSNRIDLHPILFALYGGIVYHHGSGFRGPLSRGTVSGRRDYVGGGGMKSAQGSGRRGRSVLGESLNRVHDRKQSRIDSRLSERVFGMLTSDPQFFSCFL